MISAALTSFLTGITEPIEFSFMFVAPILYIIHAILAGLAFPICILLGMRDGTSFSHGLIDFIVLSGNSSKLWLFPIVGIGYAIVYYTIFRVLIKALDLKTPGREDATEDAKRQVPAKWHRLWLLHLVVKKTLLTSTHVLPVCASALLMCLKWIRPA